MPTIETIVDEGVAWIPPRPSPRSLRLPHRPGRADALIGLRRSGKTWRMFQQMHELLDGGVPREHLLYLNLEDERLVRPEAGDLTQLYDAWLRRVPEIAATGGHLFLDEVQRVPGWERFVRRLLETTPHRLTVTGSSAKLLAGELATSLRGRCHRLEMHPFSFGEWLRRRDITPAEAGEAALETLCRRYLTEGGMPDVFADEDAQRLAWLQDHAHAVVLRDVVERHRVANPEVLRELARELLSQTARKFSVNRFFQKLKSLGYRVGRESLRRWYDYLQEACLVAGIPVASRSPQVRRVNPQKVYVADTGLAHAHSHLGARDTGHLLETAVYWELRRRGYECAWVQTHRGHEVDFLAVAPRGERRLVQACAEFGDAVTRDRELRALFEAMEELHVGHSTIVTLGHRESFSVGDGEVSMLPAWDWLVSEA